MLLLNRKDLAGAVTVPMVITTFKNYQEDPEIDTKKNDHSS